LPAIKILKTLCDKLLNFIYPLYCAVCSKPLEADEHRRICDSCWASIIYVKSRIIPLPEWLDGAYSCCLYEGAIKKCIHLFKYRKKKWLAVPLGGIMGACAGAVWFPQEIDLLVPVPLHKRSLRERGFNQSSLLAANVAAALRKELSAETVVKKTYTKNQVGLSKEERKKNLEGAFSVNPAEKVKEKNILLVDDVCTTGATLGECARVLKENGAGKVFALVLAHGL